MSYSSELDIPDILIYLSLVHSGIRQAISQTEYLKLIPNIIGVFVIVQFFFLDQTLQM